MMKHDAAAVAAANKKIGAKIGSLENIHWKSQGGAPGLIYRDRPLINDTNNNASNIKDNNNFLHNNSNNINSKRHQPKAGGLLPLVPRGPRWRQQQQQQPEGEIGLMQEKLEFQKKARAKIGSLENIHYKSGSVGVYPFTSPPKGN